MSESRMLVTASAAAIVTGLLAYAVYFDHRRRNSPEFRRSLRRNERKQARSEKEGAEAAEAGRLNAIRQAVDEAKLAGYPRDVEEKELYFQEQLTIGETLSTDPTSDVVETALHFYNALKVYPSPGDLIHIFNNIVPKPTLDVLAEMIAYDTTLKLGAPDEPKVVPVGAGMFEEGSDGGMPPSVGLD